MNETTITLVGNVVNDPVFRTTDSGYSVLNFRVASTSRRFDMETKQWKDTGTIWANVSCWRAMAENARRSIRKGQPVVVTGRFYGREWVRDEQLRTSYEIDATSVGHDLNRGESSFTKVVRSQTPPPLTASEMDDVETVASSDDRALASIRDLVTAN